MVLDRSSARNDHQHLEHHLWYLKEHGYKVVASDDPCYYIAFDNDMEKHHFLALTTTGYDDILTTQHVIPRDRKVKTCSDYEKRIIQELGSVEAFDEKYPIFKNFSSTHKGQLPGTYALFSK